MSDVPDDVLLPLRELLRDWEDYDVAGFYPGKALGVIPPGDCFGKAKHLFWAASEDGIKLIHLIAESVRHRGVRLQSPGARRSTVRVLRLG